jgi:hypothetical protein
MVAIPIKSPLELGLESLGPIPHQFMNGYKISLDITFRQKSFSKFSKNVPLYNGQVLRQFFFIPPTITLHTNV